MILGAYHGLYALSVGKGENRNLGACQELLDNDVVARIAELFVLHDGLDRGDRLVDSLSDDNALAERKTVSLDYYGSGVFGFNVSYSLFGIVKNLVLSGGDTVFFHQVLGENL